jgi:predicted ATPase
MIVVEEVENGLDPWTLNAVLNALKLAANDGIQVILTTHSPYLLDQVDLDQVLHVRRVEGDTTIRAITAFDQVAKFRGRVGAGAMYLAGFFR